MKETISKAVLLEYEHKAEECCNPWFIQHLNNTATGRLHQALISPRWDRTRTTSSNVAEMTHRVSSHHGPSLSCIFWRELGENFFILLDKNLSPQIRREGCKNTCSIHFL